MRKASNTFKQSVVKPGASWFRFLRCGCAISLSVNKTAIVMEVITAIIIKLVVKIWGENYVKVISNTGILSVYITHVDVTKLHNYINR